MTDSPLPGARALSELGLPAPSHTAPASPHAFPDGGRWRTELPSCEGPAVLAAALKQADELEVPLHRISQGSGVWMLTDAEITEMVQVCTERNIELCLFLGPRGTWSAAASTLTPSGGAGLRAHGLDQVGQCIEDAQRAVALGVRCLLVADEGVLFTLHRMRAAGALPADVTLKVSALVGPVNPMSFAVWEGLGADSINVPSDLSLQAIADLRQASRAPVDFYVEAPDDLGGFVRLYDAAELIRVGAPIYLKFGLRNAPGIYPTGAHLEATAIATGRERIRRGRLVLDILERLGAREAMSPLGSRLPGQLRRFAEPAGPLS
jgi:hypothetical protein